MFLEDILPQIRAGRKARRTSWESGTNPITTSSTWIEFSQIMADDWELVPEPKPKKFQSWVKLYDNGSVFGYNSLEEAMKSLTLAEHNGKAKLVETREIEWSVE
jgi:hypothetical protein